MAGMERSHRERPLQKDGFCSKSRKAKNKSGGILQVFRGVDFESDKEFGQGASFGRGLREWIAAVALILVVLVCYGRTLDYGFIKLDDNLLVYRNIKIQKGLTPEGLVEVFTSRVGALWIPLTQMSFMLEADLHGLNPGGCHLTNVILHGINVLLFFFLARRLTGSTVSGAFAAGLLAAHPLHVESVAWITERNNLLSAMFWLLALRAWCQYVERKSRGRYVLVLVLFFLGGLAKPSIVTLPFVLLLLDFWPLGRLAAGWSRSGLSSAGRLVFEKIPFFLVSGLLSAVTMATSVRTGAVAGWESHPLSTRLANALVSYAAYLGKMVWPVDLAVLYPHPGPGGVSIAPAAASALFLSAVTVLVLKRVPSRPYEAVGWFWYLGVMFPVIGLVQVGPQSMADRYAYLPFMGLYLAVGRAAWEWGKVSGRRKTAVCTAMALILASLTVAARMQVRHWRNDAALFGHAAAVTRDNYLMHLNYGEALTRAGDLEGALAQFALAWQIKPRDALTNYNLGVVLVMLGRPAAALPHARAALRADPLNGQAHLNLGAILVKLRRTEEAGAAFQDCLRLNPADAKGLYNLGMIHLARGETAEAINLLSRAVKARPDMAPALRGLKRAVEARSAD